MKFETSEYRADDPEVARARFRADVVAGLSANPKWIPSKYFYDELGSALFDRICDLDEYYLTRAELEIMESHASEMARRCGPNCMLVEYGSGSSIKTEILLDRLEEPVAYVPIDISASHLFSSVERLRQRFPSVPILPVAADYTEFFNLPQTSRPPDRTVVYFPGSTIGNFEPSDARGFLARVRTVCGPTGAVLIGVDLAKDAAVLEAAYNDAAGITAAFNLNLLERINRELDGDFVVERFQHRASYDAVAGRIEMHLISRVNQQVHIGDHTVSLGEGEVIRTEYSYKYTVDGFRALAAAAGFQTLCSRTDSSVLFSVYHLEPV